MDATVTQLESDFCVVGAGYAGLMDAKPRIGGRTWTEHHSDGTPNLVMSGNANLDSG
jgi:hypothetical protein